VFTMQALGLLNRLRTHEHGGVHKCLFEFSWDVQVQVNFVRVRGIISRG